MQVTVILNTETLEQADSAKEELNDLFSNAHAASALLGHFLAEQVIIVINIRDILYSEERLERSQTKNKDADFIRTITEKTEQ